MATMMGSCVSAYPSAGLAEMQAYQNAYMGQRTVSQQAQSQSYPSPEQVRRVESLLMKGKKVESKGLFASMKDGVVEFFSENRSIISWLALIFLVDHFFFHGTFRDRLHKMVEGMIGKIEKQIEAK